MEAHGGAVTVEELLILFKEMLKRLFSREIIAWSGRIPYHNFFGKSTDLVKAWPRP